MYIRRKVFSTLVDEETGEERLFSTTEFINEDNYLEDRMYSDDDELTTADKINLWGKKHFMTKKDREAYIKAVDENDWKPYVKHVTKIGATKGGIIGGLHGAIGGALAGGATHGTKGALLGAGLGAAGGAGIGAGMGAGAGYLSSKLTSKGVKDARKRKSNNKYMQELKEESDLMKVASGKMSKKDFIKKNYNKD